MSMRATFTTEFIYDGAPDYLDRRQKIMEVLHTSFSDDGGNVIGQIAGIIGGLDLAESDIKRWINEECRELRKITIVPFKIVWLLEGGDLIIKQILPIKKLSVIPSPSKQ